MKRYEQPVIHGTLIDSINIKGLIETQANQPTFLGTPKNVVSVKIKSKGNVKKLIKVRTTLK